MTQQKTARYEAGATLTPVTKLLTQGQINRYADASGDHNPLHLDPEFAATTQFEGVIAHGMLVLAYVSEMLTATFGASWPASGRLKVRFRGAARPGDAVTARGTIARVDGARIVCNVEAVNQSGEVLISGDAEVTTA